MAKKRHQIIDNNRAGGNKKRSSEESQLLHKLNTHFKKLSKTRSGNDAIATVTTMHASPCNSSTRVIDINDDHYHASASTSAAVVEFKFNNNGKPLDYSNVCSAGRSTEIPELFGGDFTFAPDLNAAHSLVHLEFVADCDGAGYGLGSTCLSDPIAFVDVDTTDMLKLSSQEEMIQEFLKNNLFD